MPAPTRVVKRDGSIVSYDSSNIAERITELAGSLVIVPVGDIVSSLESKLPDLIRTIDIDTELAELVGYLNIREPDMSILAGRILMSNIRKMAPRTFSDSIRRMHERGLVCDELSAFVARHAEELDAMIDHSRDEDFDFFAARTLLQSYIVHYSPDGVHRDPMETPQYMFARVAVALHCLQREEPDIQAAKFQYELTSRKFYTHASPTLYNAGTNRPQMSSCFLLTMKDDSVEGIFDTLSSCATISKYAGGLGLSISHVRARGSRVGSAGGKAAGTIAAMKLFNQMISMVDQANGKRKGGIAVYMEPWHADIYDFVACRRPTGKEDMLCRDIFTALWIPDLFMKRVADDASWSLFCPIDAPGLCDAHSAAFEELYTRYEREGKARRVVRARELMDYICAAQCEAGVPYMLYKDAANAKSNQQHLGCIRSSNLCTEIIEYTSSGETAVCNLASICVNKFDVRERPMEQILDAAARSGMTLDVESVGMCPDAAGAAGVNFQALYIVARFVTRALDRVIDLNWYPTPAARASNMMHRPIGIGIQGLADLFAQRFVPFESVEAWHINRDLFKTIYAAAVRESSHLARRFGSYASFAGSPASRGLLQPHLWAVHPEKNEFQSAGGPMFDWEAIAAEAARGMRHSLLIAPMPTATTSQLLGNNECFEPFTSNLYTRSTTAGTFIMVNRHLIAVLKERQLWSHEMIEALKHERGSVQRIAAIPQDVKDVFKTAWEIKQSHLIGMAKMRGPFICQSQSLNIFIEEPTRQSMFRTHMYAWRAGLKTGMYYLRRLTVATAVPFTVDKDAAARALAPAPAPAPATAAVEAACESCSA